MKKLFWTFSAYIKQYLIWLLYLLFFIFTLLSAKDAETLGNKIFYAAFGTIVFAFVIYYERLRSIYNKMTTALTRNCDIPAAEAYQTKLIKADIFHAFKRSLILFDILLLLDKGHYAACLTLIKEHQPFLQSDPKYKMTCLRTQLECYYLTGRVEPALSVIAQLESLKASLSPAHKASQSISWEEIAGIKYFLQNRNGKSLKEFQNVYTGLLNERELTYYYLELAKTLQNLNQQNKAVEARKKAKEIGHTLAVVNENN